MSRIGTFHPFEDGDTFATFANVIDKAVSEIEGLENDYVLKAAPSELEQYYRDKVELCPLTLDSENYYIESSRNRNRRQSRLAAGAIRE